MNQIMKGNNMKRKSLLVAMAAMSLAAIGAGSVSTLAWFQATASAAGKKASAAMEGTVIGADGVQEAKDYYVKLSITPQAGGTKLTTTDGYTYGVVNGLIVDAVEGNLDTRYGSATLSATWYEDAACNTELSAEKKAQLVKDDTGLTFTIGGKDTDAVTAGVQTRLRVSLVAPEVDATGVDTDKSFGKVFGSTLGNTVSVTVTWAAGGAFTLSDSTVYYAISGTDALQLKSAADLTIGTSANAEANTGTYSIASKCVLEAK